MLNDKPKHIMHGKHIYSLLDFINFNFNGDEPKHPIILKLGKILQLSLKYDLAY
jgi:hypothetical protein